MKHLVNKFLVLTLSGLLLSCVDLEEKPVGILAPESYV